MLWNRPDLLRLEFLQNDDRDIYLFNGPTSGYWSFAVENIQCLVMKNFAIFGNFTDAQSSCKNIIRG